MNGSSIDVMAELGILRTHEVAELLNLRESTVLDLSRRDTPAGWPFRRDL